MTPQESYEGEEYEIVGIFHPTMIFESVYGYLETERWIIQRMEMNCIKI